MQRIRRAAARLVALAGVTLGLVPVGCTAPPATVELIAVARKALTDAAALEGNRLAQSVQGLDEQAAALDAAFDADVRMVEAGKLADAEGEPVALTAEWVISARKGYAAARSALADQRRRMEAQHAACLDNLAAGGEALDLATQLILQQYALSQRAMRLVGALERRLSDE